MPQTRTIRRADRWASSIAPVDLSVAIPTSRRDPGIDRIAADLAAQLRAGDRVEIVVVDALSRAAQDLAGSADDGRIAIRAEPPKPTPWQGAQRVTSADWWAASSARNTGIALCRADYVAFLDDRSALDPGWLDRVRSAASERAIVAGSYDREDDGQITHDHRRAEFPEGRRDCGGGWLYGGSFCAPLARLLDVGGFEEGCDGSANEDCVLGHMLVNRGHRIHFDARMRSTKIETRSGDSGHGLLVASDPARSAAIRRRFYRRSHTEFTPDLRRLRAEIAAGDGFPDVDQGSRHLDWHSGAPLSELRGRPY
jgi:glycosyltransferase involved in cell wall biosynthesis